MVLINEKKYACATCIKGHRVSTCTHTDRPLFEVKKKGRPATQCVHCREKRKNGTGNGTVVHTKCACGETKPPAVIMPGASSSSAAAAYPKPPSSTASGPSSNPSSATIPFQESSVDIETRKGRPGANATYPNGLKDVHEMAAAAEALSGMGGDEAAMKMAERKVANLLNPCHCTTGGKCRCCVPKSERAASIRGSSPTSSGAVTPNHSHGVTDGLIEMFQSKATTSTTPTEGGSCCSSSTRPNTASSATPTWAQLMTPRETHLSPANMHHPAHTSPHVHKTKLYSPYSTSGHSTPRHGQRRETPSSSGIRRGGHHTSDTERHPAPKLRPLSDMNTLLGAVFREDGTIAETIPRSALGLPGIATFDQVAEEGGVKFEPMELDAPIQFPTKEDVVIGACGCGENCDCPDCATHGNPSRTGSAMGHTGGGGCCGQSCKSSFDCSDHLSLPRGITSIGHLLSLAAANVPHPAQRRPIDLNAHATDTRVLPPAAHHNEDAARSLGLVTLKPLECCNGRCQCPPGKCTCLKECCGCCVRCACDEDGDSRMNGFIAPQEQVKSGCCSTSTEPQRAGSVSSLSASATPRQPSPAKSSIATPPSGVSPMSAGPNPLGTPPIGTATDAVRAEGRRNSPQPSASGEPQAVRRASSTTGQGKPPSAASSRRSTITNHGVQRSASTGKQASKALALHSSANHPHAHPHPTHRPILPKPPSGSHLGGSKTGHPSRVASPAIHSQGHGQAAAVAASASMQNSRHGSPTIGTTGQEAPALAIQLPEPAVQPQSNAPQNNVKVPAIPTMPHMSQSNDFVPNQNFAPNPSSAETQQTVTPGEPAGNDDYEMDDELLAFINQFTASQNEGNQAYIPAPSSDSSMDQPLVTPDLEFNPQISQPMVSGSGQQSAGADPNLEDQFMAMLNSALSDGSNQYFPPMQSAQAGMTSNTNPGPLPANQQQQRQQPQPQPQQATRQQPNQAYTGSEAWAPTMQQFVSSITGSSQQGGSLPSGPQLGYQSPILLSDGTANPQIDGGFATSLVEYLANQAAASAPIAQQTQPEPIYRQLPPQSTAFLQQMLGNNPAFGAQTNLQQTNSLGGGNGQSSSNMIDLSKPLNANDVERILRALQDQQGQDNSSTSRPNHNPSPDRSSMYPQDPLAGGMGNPAQFANMHKQSQSSFGNFLGNPTQPPSPKPNMPNQQQGTKQYNQNTQAPFDSAALFNPFSTSDDLFDKYMTSGPMDGQDGINGFMDVNGLNNQSMGSGGSFGAQDVNAWLGQTGSQSTGSMQGQGGQANRQILFDQMMQGSGV